ncbi:hypothetical protein OXPF_30490 [Oxobacter pfennigii]|uniref:Uncharacterized protein n=1 Tax=Oxobacter pfennigii TaxID=36849 RepID=A0A0N8NT20_9CLOT|nr:hypothetical protein [Oxobacter pfennigii]KPU43608.1 hypothetical protein OXPF_30490 [Oxobacter pfennigii]
MKDEKVILQFKKARMYKNIGFIIMLLSIIPSVIWRTIFGFVLTAIIIGIGIYFERLYKCPVCGFIFDTRVKSDEIRYCSSCSAKLQ